MTDDTYGSDAVADPDEETTTMSYMAVGLGLPVVTHSGKQFGVVEHVLQVPEEDLFDGVVVYTGSLALFRHPGNERRTRLEMLRIGQMRGWLKFVDADQVAAITPGYVKCSFEMDQVALLPEPNGPPVLHPDMAREDHASTTGMYPQYGQWLGRWFNRPRWTP